MNGRPVVAVLGSAHMDLIAHAPAFPTPGGSVLANRVERGPGGKAAVQATQLARAGAEARLLTRLGEDAFGDAIAAALATDGVDLSATARVAGAETGVSLVTAAEGDYASVIAPGAAAGLSAADVDAAADTIAGADALLLQLELPPKPSRRAVEIAVGAGVPVILNAAPPDRSPVTADLARRAQTLAVNRVEALALLASVGFDRAPEADDALAADLAAATGAATILLTLGAAGALLWEAGATWRQTPPAIDVVDTVGAGDACLGAYLAARLAGGAPSVALRRGVAAGAVAASRAGAVAAQPTAAEVDAVIGSL